MDKNYKKLIDMKLRLVIGAILAVAAAFRLLVLCGIIPLEPLFSEEYESLFEPYFNAAIVLFVGAFLCYDSYKNMKGK